MKLISTQLAYFFEDRHMRQNLWALLRYVGALLLVVALFTVLFHVIMAEVEGKDHSWVTGFYWTLTVMSTLGFGDVTFESDVGRLFSVVVLVTGVVMLLIVLPFAFIRFFYAPWLEAQIRRRAPRRVPDETNGHVIICAYDGIAAGLIQRLEQEGIPYFIVEPDREAAGDYWVDGVSVIAGAVDASETYDALGVERARMVLANREDTVNTNITLSVRERTTETPVVALAAQEASVDVLELTGATRVLPLRRWLGEHLANRVNAAHAESHVIGGYEDLLIAELPVHNTPLEGQTIQETTLRRATGVSIIGVWEHGHFRPARPDRRLTTGSVPVVAGTQAQLDALDERLVIYDVSEEPVLVIGGGVVGRAAARALQGRGVAVHVVERKRELCRKAGAVCDEVFHGDAADYALLARAGIEEAPSVLLTTGDDAMNVYLAAYCRRLNADLRVVSRITHERNLDAIHRAGADIALSYSSLGVEAVFSALTGRELSMLGEGVSLFSVAVPGALAGRTLGESGIGAETGLNVIAVQPPGEAVVTNPPAATALPAGAHLVILGSPEQREHFTARYGD
jgi:Trk K+ transport system NAD-binding subunit